MSTTPRYLLDTNILSDLIRHPQGKVYQRIKTHGEVAICTSIICAAELRFGAAKKASPALTQRIEQLLANVHTLAFDHPADAAYGQLRQHLQQAGNTIGPNDLLIAAHALSLDLIVITDNEREFRRVPNLQVENWLKTDKEHH